MVEVEDRIARVQALLAGGTGEVDEAVMLANLRLLQQLRYEAVDATSPAYH